MKPAMSNNDCIYIFGFVGMTGTTNLKWLRVPLLSTLCSHRSTVTVIFPTLQLCPLYYFFSPVSGPFRLTTYVTASLSLSPICISLKEEKLVCLHLSRHKGDHELERETERHRIPSTSVNILGILFKGVRLTFN